LKCTGLSNSCVILHVGDEREVGHAESIEKIRHTYRILIEDSGRKILLGKLRSRGGNYIKPDFKMTGCEVQGC
jgi:hypothetical protein